MLLYCKAGVVLSWHDDAHEVDPALYGEDVYVIPVPNGLTLERIGEAPGTHPILGQIHDSRPFAAPKPTPALLAGYAARKRTQAEAAVGPKSADFWVATDAERQSRVERLKQLRAAEAAAVSGINAKPPTVADFADIDRIFAGQGIT
jgi:hypothetical protein